MAANASPSLADIVLFGRSSSEGGKRNGNNKFCKKKSGKQRQKQHTMADNPGLGAGVAIVMVIVVLIMYAKAKIREWLFATRLPLPCDCRSSYPTDCC